MKRAFRQKLTDLIDGPILFDEPLDRYTSLRVGGRTDVLVFPNSVEELRKLVLLFGEADFPFFVAGNWTNVLAPDEGYRGAIIAMGHLRSVTWAQEQRDHVTVDAQAGASLAELVRLTAEKALAGLTFCAGIPGSVGGAVMMNAGAFGSEIKDVLCKATLMGPGGVLEERLCEDLCFEYRRLVIPGGTIVISAAFRLVPGARDQIQGRIEEIMARRRQKHPLDYPSAGSIFKNPSDHSAGALIEAAGLKGMQIGGARISEKHGNFIVNTGGARAADILALMDLVREKVFSRTGIALDAEIRIIGN